jgi:hypothetical protein
MYYPKTSLNVLTFRSSSGGDTYEKRHWLVHTCVRIIFGSMHSRFSTCITTWWWRREESYCRVRDLRFWRQWKCRLWLWLHVILYVVINVSEERIAPIFRIGLISTMKLKTVRSSQTLVTTYKVIFGHNTEDHSQLSLHWVISENCAFSVEPPSELLERLSHQAR